MQLLTKIVPYSITVSIIAIFTAYLVNDISQNQSEVKGETYQSIPTVILTPTPTPTATPKPAVKGTTVKYSPPTPTPTPDLDPVITCRSSKTTETKEIRRSECDKMVDCQLGDSWRITTRDECSTMQNSRQQQSNMVNCQIGDEWIALNKDECNMRQAQKITEMTGQVYQDTWKRYEEFRTRIWNAKSVAELEQLKQDYYQELSRMGLLSEMDEAIKSIQSP